MAECEKCGKEHIYYGPHNERTRFYTVEMRDERTHGRMGIVHYCIECAPFGNTKIPDQLGESE